MESQTIHLPPSTSTFTPFPRLPLELRREIWRLTIPTLPRFIPHAPHQLLSKNDPSRAICFCIDRESRDVYLETYTANHSWDPDLPTCCGWKDDIFSPYVNLEHDVLFWRWDTDHPFSACKRYRLKPDMNGKLRHLAIEEELFEQHSAIFIGDAAYGSALEDDKEPNALGSNNVDEEIYEFSGLETLTIVDNYHRPGIGQELQENLRVEDKVLRDSKGKEEFVEWLEDLKKQRPQWKAPELRFMDIGLPMTISCGEL